MPGQGSTTGIFAALRRRVGKLLSTINPVSLTRRLQDVDYRHQALATQLEDASASLGEEIRRVHQKIQDANDARFERAELRLDAVEQSLNAFTDGLSRISERTDTAVSRLDHLEHTMRDANLELSRLRDQEYSIPSHLAQRKVEYIWRSIRRKRQGLQTVYNVRKSYRGLLQPRSR